MNYLDYANQFFDVIQKYVETLFSLMILPGVSIGSLLLYSLLAYVVVTNIFPRK